MRIHLPLQPRSRGLDGPEEGGDGVAVSDAVDPFEALYARGVTDGLPVVPPTAERVVPLTPLGRRAHVSEISAAVAFLASDDAVFVTGTEMIVDGGYLAR